MASDQLVRSDHVLKAILEIKRTGSWKALEQLEAREPDLAEYILETLSALHQRLQESHLPEKRVRRLYHETQTLVVVAIAALQHAHYDLWQREHGQPTTPQDKTDDSESPR